MGGKFLTFTDVFDACVPIAADISSAFAWKITFDMFTDSKQDFDVIARGKAPTKKTTSD